MSSVTYKSVPTLVVFATTSESVIVTRATFKLSVTIFSEAVNTRVPMESAETSSRSRLPVRLMLPAMDKSPPTFTSLLTLKLSPTSIEPAILALPSIWRLSSEVRMFVAVNSVNLPCSGVCWPMGVLLISAPEMSN